MFLSELLKDWPAVIQGKINTEINAVCQRLEDLQRGDLFIAFKGTQFNSEKLIGNAIAKGAGAIVIENELL